MALLTVDQRSRKIISDYRNNFSDDNLNENMGGGGKGGGGDAGDLGFDDILQQLKRLSDEINKELIHLNDPDLCNFEPKFRFSFKSEPDFHRQFLSEFQSDPVSKSRTGFQSKFRSASVHEPSIEIQSNCTALADERRALPVIMAGALRESSDPSLCCFPTQMNSGRSSGKISQKSQTGGNNAGQVLYHFWKSHSEEGSRKRGEVQTSEGGSQLQSVKCAPTAKHSLSYDESNSAARQSSRPGYASPSVMDGILSTLQNRQTGGNRESSDVLSSFSSGREHTELQSPVTSSQTSNRSITAQDGSSCEQLTGGKMPFDNKPPVKTFALDPTKYQLRSSERRNVPQMGRQRRNCGTGLNDSSSTILCEADYSNDDVACRDNSTGLHGSQQIQAASSRQNGSFIETGWKDTTMTPSQPRAHSLGSESGVPGYRADGSSIRSSHASVCRHLSLETEAYEGSQNLMGRDQDTTPSKLVSWMSSPDSPDYAVPFDTLVADIRMVRNSAKIDSTVILPHKAGTAIQAVRTCRKSGVNVTSPNERTMMVKPRLIDDSSISLKSCPADPYEPDAMKNLFHCVGKGEILADKSDTLKARSPGICPAVPASYKWETRPVAAEDRAIPNVADKSSHPESIYSSQNVIDPSGHGHQVLSKGPNCVPAWDQPIPDLQNASDMWANKNDKLSSASGSVNKVSRSKEQNKTRIQQGQLTSGFIDLNLNQQPTKKNEGVKHFTSASLVEEASNVFRMPEAKSPGTHFPSADCVQQFQQRTPVYAHYNYPWDNMLITDYSDGDNPSESIASDLKDLFRSTDSISVRNLYPRDYQSSSTCGRLGRPNSPRSNASTETLRDFEENENNVMRKDNRLIHNSANDPFGQSCFLSPDISYDHDRSNEVFDQNNNQQFFDEEEEEFFGTSAGSTLDWCYKWEWDSPTSTLQRSVIRRPAFQRNNSVIPLVNNRTKQNTDSSTTPSQESNPDVIPMIAPPPRLLSIKNRGHNFPGAKICYYIVSLASESEFFGAMVKNFIQCTMTGVEMNPHTVIRNIRQCIDGLKNYLMQQREAKLNEFIRLECSKINSGEFLNLDAITERALHKCIIRPLHNHINKLFVYDFTRNGNLQLMADGIKSAKAKGIFERGGQTNVISHQSKSVSAAQHFLRRMTETYSPIKKLENLIAAVSMIAGNDTICSNQMRWSAGATAPLRTDELLMQLMYVLVDQDMTSAEIEANYIWGLIHPSFLTGERTYYLTLFSSAIALIKNLSKSSSPTMDNCLQRISANGLLKICIPDEKQDNIWTQTLPFQPNMTTTDICQMMAYKLSITNPHEYGLYLINNGEEKRLSDTTNLSDVKTASKNNHLLAYKRISAKFIWPKSRR